MPCAHDLCGCACWAAGFGWANVLRRFLVQLAPAPCKSTPGPPIRTPPALWQWQHLGAARWDGRWGCPHAWVSPAGLGRIHGHPQAPVVREEGRGVEGGHPGRSEWAAGLKVRPGFESRRSFWLRWLPWSASCGLSLRLRGCIGAPVARPAQQPPGARTAGAALLSQGGAEQRTDRVLPTVGAPQPALAPRRFARVPDNPRRSLHSPRLTCVSCRH